MSFIVSDIKDIDTEDKLYSLLKEAKDPDATFLDDFFVPEIDYIDFFGYLLSEGIICESVYNNIVRNIQVCEEYNKGRLKDEEYYFIAMGIAPKHICGNEAEGSYLLFGTEEALEDIDKYGYLVFKYLFNNKEKDEQIQSAYETLFADMKDCFETASVEIPYKSKPTEFDFFARSFNSEQLSILESILEDCIEITDDDMLKGMLEEAMKVIK